MLGSLRAAAVSAADAWQVGISLAQSTGNYGRTSTTDLSAATTTLRYRGQRLLWQLRLPAYSISGPAAVAIGPDGLPVGNSSAGAAGTVTRSGMGDPAMTVGYELIRSRQQILELRASAKLAMTSAARGLGTGRNDYWMEARYLRLVGRWTPFLDAGYRFNGRPANVALRDCPFASAGLSYRVTRQWSAGGYVSWRAPVLTGRTSNEQVALFGRYAANARWHIDAYAAHGLTTGSPTWMGGLAFERSFSQ
ncbi:MAG: transporter [Gammaproteobacteria bacterium]|nr:transporter [Gammaproteobacteria bacterium]